MERAVLRLAPVAEVADNKAILVKDLAGRAEAAILFYLRGFRNAACAEKAVRLVLSKVILPVGRACAAVLHADLPVLIGIRNGNRAAFHDEWIVSSGIIGFPLRPGRSIPGDPVLPRRQKIT